MHKIIISDERGYRGPTHFAKTQIARLVHVLIYRIVSNCGPGGPRPILEGQEN